MPKKIAHLFIDASNTYHALKDNNLYEYFSYGWLFQELSKKFDLQQVFFYDAVKSINIEPEQYSEQQKFHERLRKQIPIIKIRTRKLRYLRTDDRVEKAKSKTSFCAPCKGKVDTFLKDAGLCKLSKEKGIDILMVTDLIKGAFQKKYDVALLLTGDADFVPAVELAQILGEEVVNIHCYAGSSGELRAICDSHVLIDIDGKYAPMLKYN